MPLDQYSPCPCGSGKKLKFCKCVEQPQEYEKLIRLMEGGQGLAAMDRINQMLAKTPNAAWLLALKGELSLELQEFETFKETANRFLKLKPDNPLALIMKSVGSMLARDRIEESAQYLLSGLAESRETVPPMAIFAIDLLIGTLEKLGKLSLVGYWADVQRFFLDDENSNTPSVLRERSLNLIVKVPSRLLDDPPGAAWKERLSEVVSLFRIFSFSQGETKLRSILRDFPDQPGPLSFLLRAQMAQLKQQEAHTTARKLADHQGLSDADRGYYLALAIALEEDGESLVVDTLSHYCAIESVERAVEAISQLDYVQDISNHAEGALCKFYADIVGDEIPARHAYTVFDRPIPSGPTSPEPQSEDSSTSTTRAIASAVATIVLYGKQTDKPARCLYAATHLPSSQPIIDETLQLLQLGEAIETEREPLKSDLMGFLLRPRFASPSFAPLSIEQTGSAFIEDFLDAPLKILAGSTPRQVAGQEQYRTVLFGLLSYVEGAQRQILPVHTISALYQQLGLERPGPLANFSLENLSITNILDLERVNLSSLNDDHLAGVFVPAMTLGASRVVYHAAKLALEREGLVNNRGLKILALTALQANTPDIEECIQYSHELIRAYTESGASAGRVVIDLLGILLSRGRESEAEQVLKDALRTNPNDPYLLTFLQQLAETHPTALPTELSGMQERQLNSGLHQNIGSETNSGLLLPGQQPAASTGESKLWLPGS